MGERPFTVTATHMSKALLAVYQEASAGARFWSLAESGNKLLMLIAGQTAREGASFADHLPAGSVYASEITVTAAKAVDQPHLGHASITNMLKEYNWWLKAHDSGEATRRHNGLQKIVLYEGHGQVLRCSALLCLPYVKMYALHSDRTCQ